MIKQSFKLSVGLLIPFLLISCSNEDKKVEKENKVMSQKDRVKSDTKQIEIHTMLEVAYYGQPQLIQRYLDHGHSIDQEDKNSKATPIYYAIQANQVETVKALLSYNADLEHHNTLGQTPLHMAVSLGRSAIVDLLLERGANINAKDNNELTPLIYAIENKHPNIAQKLIEKGASLEADKKYGLTPLHSAIQHKDIKTLSLLLNQRTIDINHQNIDGSAPLHYAVIANNFKSVELLVNKGVKLDLQDKEGSTPLSVAVSKNQIKIVKFLLSHGADKTIKDKNGDSPLDFAKKSWNQALKKVVLDEKK